MLIDAFALDVLHHEVGTPARRNSSIQQPGYIGMAHPGQDLPFHLEMAKDQIGIHSPLQDFDRRSLLELSVGPLRQIDAAHPSFSDVGHDLPMSEMASDEGFSKDRVGDEVTRLLMSCQQGFPLRSYFGGTRASLVQISRALRSPQIKTRVENLLDPDPSLGVHYALLSSRNSQA